MDRVGRQREKDAPYLQADESEAIEPAQNEKEVIENLRFLSETHRGLHKQRQTYEFRVLFTALTFYAVSIGAGLSGKLSVPSERVWIVWVGLVGSSLLVSVVLFYLHQSNRKNITLAENSEIAIMGWLRDQGYDVKTEIQTIRVGKRSMSPSWIWQTLTVVGFAILAAVALTFGP